MADVRDRIHGHRVAVHLLNIKEYLPDLVIALGADDLLRCFCHSLFQGFDIRPLIRHFAEF